MLLGLLLFIGVLPSYAQSSKTFTLNSRVGDQIVMINGTQFSIDSNAKSLPTNYPAFDTLFLSTDPRSDEPILCNFKPDSSYTLSWACCGSFDVIPSSRFTNDSLDLWDYEEDFDKIQGVFMDKPFISIKTKKKPKENVYAWHADAACQTEHSIINKKPWQLGVPPKCFYWNNITTILFFKTDDQMEEHEGTDLEEFLGIKNIVELNAISFRLFDNQRFVITYDEKWNKVILEYE